MWYFNPTEPTGQTTRPGRLRTHPGVSEWGAPPAYRLNVELGPSDLLHGVHLLPEADGTHYLRRRRATRPYPGDEPVDFARCEPGFEEAATAHWTAPRSIKPPQREDDPVEQWLPGEYARWHLAYGFRWSQLLVLGNASSREALRDALGDLLFFLDVYGYEPNPDVLDDGEVEFPSDRAWCLWYGPDLEYVDRFTFGVPWPYYISPAFGSDRPGTPRRTAFAPLAPPLMFRRFMGLAVYGAQDFPTTLTLEPVWP